MNIRHLLTALVAAHLALGFGSSALVRRLSWPDPRVVVFLAIFLSQAGLLGFWLANGRCQWARRLLCGIAAVVYLGILPVLFTGHSRRGDFVMFLLLAALGMLSVGALCVMTGRFGPRLRLAAMHGAPLPPPVQISTKALFVLTAGVAVVLAMFSILENSSIPPELSISIVVGASLGWISWWAALAALIPWRPVLPMIAAIGFSAFLGALPPRYLSAQLGPHAMRVGPWAMMAALQAAIVCLTLFIVRWAGYRLVPEQGVCSTGSS